MMMKVLDSAPSTREADAEHAAEEAAGEVAVL